MIGLGGQENKVRQLFYAFLYCAWKISIKAFNGKTNNYASFSITE